MKQWQLYNIPQLPDFHVFRLRMCGFLNFLYKAIQQFSWELDMLEFLWFIYKNSVHDPENIKQFVIVFSKHIFNF